MRHIGHNCEDLESDIYRTYRTFNPNTFAASIDLSRLQWRHNGDSGSMLPVGIGHEMDPMLASGERKGLKRMIRFYCEHPGLIEKMPQLVAPLSNVSSRSWYMQKSEYELTRALPDSLESALPTIEEIEAELGGMGVEDGG